MLRRGMTDSNADREEHFLGQTEVYRQILDAIADMVLVKGARSRILWANRAFCDYYGMTNQQLRNLVDASFNQVDYTAQYVRDDAEVYHTGRILNIPEEPVTRHDGLVQIFHTVKSPIFDPDGQPLMTVGVSRNITEQKQAKQELEQYRLHLEQLVEERTQELMRLNRSLSTMLGSLSEGVFSLDNTGRIVRVNRAAATMVGRKPNELIGLSIDEALRFEPALASTPRAFPWGIDPQGTAVQKGFLSSEPQRRPFVTLQVLPLSDHLHEPEGSVVVCRDISLEQQAEAERLRHQKLESLGLLAGGIAHDFNNILTGILGSISVARLEARDGKGVDALLDQAERACQRARGLTRQLLTFARGGAPVRTVMDVVGLVREAAELALSGSSSRLDFRAPEAVWKVAADDGQLSQVVNNLVLNANQAMPGGGEVMVSLTNTVVTSNDNLALTPGLYIRISVRDHGTGILPEHIDRVFDPYFTTKPRGSGLGLASVHSIVTKHDGCVVVQSTPLVGTQFTVFLPASEAATEKEPVQSVTLENQSRLRVLVLDDDDAVRRVVTSMLALLEHDAAVVGTSAEAFAHYQNALLENRPFDVILVDLTMPGDLSGSQVLEQLRASGCQARLVVMSGYSTEPIMNHLEAHGLSARLQKPFAVADLRQVLGRDPTPR